MFPATSQHGRGRGRGVTIASKEEESEKQVGSNLTGSGRGITAASRDVNSEKNLEMDSILRNNPEVSMDWVTSTMNKALVPQDDPALMNDTLRSLESYWFNEKSCDKNVMMRKLHKVFSSSNNPFSFSFYIITKCHDFQQGKMTTLSHLILKTFFEWKKINGHYDVDKFVTQEFKIKVFRAATGFHVTFFDMFVKCFNLDHDGNEYFLPNIRQTLAEFKFKEACQFATKLQLQQHFKIDEILVPLILQDKVNMVENYVQGIPDLQKQLVKLLDYYCDRETKMDDVISQTKVPYVKKEKMKKKILSKLAIRLMKLYDIPQDLCPNITNARAAGAVRYLLYKRYIEKSMSPDSFAEMVMGTISDNVVLQQELVESLLSYNEVEEAARWALKLELADSDIPNNVIPIRDKLKIEEAKAKSAAPAVDPNSAPPSNDGEENWEDECFTADEMQSHYYKLTLPESSIHMVDTKEKLHKCLSRLTVPGTVIGIDSEWKPSLGGLPCRIALIQLAVSDQVFLIDAISLLPSMTEADWQQFAHQLFCDENLLKLGYGIESDFQMFIKSFPTMKEPLSQLKRVVDIAAVAKVVLNMPDEDYVFAGSDEEEDAKPSKKTQEPSFSNAEGKGLSELTHNCLAKPLNKDEQMSNWERRPLRQTQIVYGALDAFVLLELYNYLCGEARHLKKPVELEPVMSMKWLKTSKRQKQKNKAKSKAKTKVEFPKKFDQQTRKTGDPSCPGDLRVVVDTMLQGLGKQLRTCGVDVHILDMYDDHEKTIQISHEENRIVLSSGTPFWMIRSHVGNNMCYNVKCSKAREQVAEVLKVFNVTVTQEDIFSRCQICNGNDYLKIPSKEMKFLWERKDLLYGKDTSAEDRAKITKENKVEYGVNFDTVTVVSTNTLLLIDLVPKPIFDKVDLFFCCAQCGKVFWEGSHFERICNQFSNVLTVNDGANIYQRNPSSNSTEEIKNKDDNFDVEFTEDSPVTASDVKASIAYPIGDYDDSDDEDDLVLC